eukprot:scaffold146724_cov36-Tisochrysis_lutea.AAC.1
MPVLGFPRSLDEPVPGSPDEPCAALAAGAPSRLEETSPAPTKSRAPRPVPCESGRATWVCAWPLPPRAQEHPQASPRQPLEASVLEASVLCCCVPCVEPP